MYFPKISVIVPVYNAAKHLDKCLDSILAQTYCNYELILIDDGSTDSSFSICSQYLNKSSKIKLYHKENGGVSSARNWGIDKAEGEWLTFVDSDDWVGPYYLENLVSHVSNGIDLVFSYAVLVDANDTPVKEIFPARILSLGNMEIAFAENAFHGHTSPWSKLYNRNLLNKINLRYNETMNIGEDLLFLYTYILHCRKIFISSDTDYYYKFEVEGSLTKRTYSLESELSGYYNIINIIVMLCSVGNIKNKQALYNLNWIKGYYARRVLNALYQEKSIKRSDRIRIIKKVDVVPYLNTFYIPALKEKCLAFLLKYNMISLYDAVRFISHKYFK